MFDINGTFIDYEADIEETEWVGEEAARVAKPEVEAEWDAIIERLRKAQADAEAEEEETDEDEDGTDEENEEANADDYYSESMAESMDGDHQSALASIGWGDDEDYNPGSDWEE